MYAGAELDKKISAFLEDRALAHPDLDLRHTGISTRKSSSLLTKLKGLFSYGSPSRTLNTAK